MEDSALSPLPEPPAPTMRPMALAAICGVLGLGFFLTLGFATQILNAAFGIWFTEIFIFLAVPWVALRAGHYEPLGYTGVQFPRLAPMGLGFGLGVANFFALVVPIQYAAQSAAPQWLRDMFDGSQIFEGQNSLELALMLAGVSVAAPVCEEFFFRGVFQKSLLASSLSKPAAVVITAVVFSAFHLDPVGFLARVELGVLFGVLRLYTGSLWPGILAHSANNVVSSLLFLLSRQTGPESVDESPPLKIVLLLMLGGMVAMGILLGLARMFPALWGPRQEPPTLSRPAPSLVRLLAPWVLGATLSVGALVLVDARGIRLSWIDLRHHLSKLPKDAPEARQKERERLLQLRQEARSGEAPVDAYEEERVRQAQEPSSEQAPEKH
ncbi:MAG: type II CAAX prenyl endopeptidase Rce1 family protein [Hyalangium sp.]|uniref:CPBP family glutamic-type intramembrane protease n=1 Tax=Hyalangium sp. TaxID=2028555 RepID=UPI00389B19C6